MKDRIYYFLYGGYCIHTEYHDRFQKFPSKRIRLFACDKFHCDNVYCSLPTLKLPIAFLRTCRQTYHEARNTIYTANIFKIKEARLGGLFLQRISNYTLTLRSVHLNICVSRRDDERQWDITLLELATNCKTLQNLYIDVRDNFRNDLEYKTLRYGPALGKVAFLRGLLQLKKLPLKTLEIWVDEGHSHHHQLVKVNDYSWMLDQRREWARSMKSAILGKD